MNSLKASQTIKQEKVDEAIEHVQKAKQIEENTKKELRVSTEKLRDEYVTFQKYMDQDMMEQMFSYAKKQLLLQENLLENLQQIVPQI